MNENNDEPKEDDKKEDVLIYNVLEYNKELLTTRKKQLYDRLKNISDDLNKSEDLDSFLFNRVGENEYEPPEIPRMGISTFFAFFTIKILGLIFITIYLIGIFELIGVTKAILDEIIFSIKLNFKYINRKNDFYDNYINITRELPNFELFFFSTIFSSLIINFIGTYFTSLIFLLFTFITIYFGLLYFNFHIENDVNKRYSFKEFIYLFFIYFFTNIFLGLIALLPHNIIKEVFLAYDWHVIIRKVKKLNNKDEALESLKKTKKSYFPMNGKFFVYLFSILGSSVVKIYLDKLYIVDEIKNNKNDKENNKNFIISIEVISLICILSTSSLYSLISILMCKKFNEDDDDNKNEASVIKIFGYAILVESIKSDNTICCQDCRAGCKKCSYSCSVYMCDCFKVCCKINNNISESNLNKERICIIYKISGLCSWFYGIINNPSAFLFILFVIFLELSNIGFRKDLEEYLEDKEEKYYRIINYIYLGSCLFIYFINILCGYSCYGCNLMKTMITQINTDYIDTDFVIKKNEAMLIMMGLFYVFFGGYLISFFLSFLTYFNFIKEFRYYLIPFSIEICEYSKIVLLYYADQNPEQFELLNKSFAISFYLLFIEIISKIIDICDIKISNLILFQFIFGCLSFLFLGFFIFVALCYLKMLKEENQEENNNNDNNNHELNLIN